MLRKFRYFSRVLSIVLCVLELKSNLVIEKLKVFQTFFTVLDCEVKKLMFKRILY